MQAVPCPAVPMVLDLYMVTNLILIFQVKEIAILFNLGPYFFVCLLYLEGGYPCRILQLEAEQTIGKILFSRILSLTIELMSKL